MLVVVTAFSTRNIARQTNELYAQYDLESHEIKILCTVLGLYGIKQLWWKLKLIIDIIGGNADTWRYSSSAMFRRLYGLKSHCLVGSCRFKRGRPDDRKGSLLLASLQAGFAAFITAVSLLDAVPSVPCEPIGLHRWCSDASSN